MQTQSIVNDLPPKLITQAGEKAKKEGSNLTGILTRFLEFYIRDEAIDRWEATPGQQMKLKKRLEKEVAEHDRDPHKKTFSSFKDMMIELDRDDEN